MLGYYKTHEGRDAVDFIEALALAGAKESNKIIGFCGSLDRPLKDVRELGYCWRLGMICGSQTSGKKVSVESMSCVRGLGSWPGSFARVGEFAFFSFYFCFIFLF
jgi:hypothetical protein